MDSIYYLTQRIQKAFEMDLTDLIRQSYTSIFSITYYSKKLFNFLFLL